MTKAIAVACDPGLSGYVVAVQRRGKVFTIVAQCAVKTGPVAMKEVFSSLARWPCVMEKVNSFGQGRKSAFTFGHNTGGPNWLLKSLGFYVEEVTPQAWEKALGLTTKGRGRLRHDQKKQRAFARALQVFGVNADIPVTLHNADAALIAYYKLVHDVG